MSPAVRVHLLPFAHSGIGWVCWQTGSQKSDTYQTASSHRSQPSAGACWPPPSAPGTSSLGHGSPWFFDHDRQHRFVLRLTRLISRSIKRKPSIARSIHTDTIASMPHAICHDEPSRTVGVAPADADQVEGAVRRPGDGHVHCREHSVVRH